MPSSSQLLAFLLASILFIQVPGPSLLFTIGRALSVGRREALLSVVGNALGLLVQVLLVALGLGAVVAASATAYTVLKLAGAAWVVWLGIKAIRHRADARVALTPGPRTPERRGAAVWTGMVVGMSNPKTIVFFVAFLPQFTDPGRARRAAGGAARPAVRGAGRGQRLGVGDGRGPGARLVRPPARAAGRDGRRRRA